MNDLRAMMIMLRMTAEIKVMRPKLLILVAKLELNYSGQTEF